MKLMKNAVEGKCGAAKSQMAMFVVMILRVRESVVALWMIVTMMIGCVRRSGCVSILQKRERNAMITVGGSVAMLVKFVPLMMILRIW